MIQYELRFEAPGMSLTDFAERVTSCGLEGATIVSSYGLWQGTLSPSYVATIIGTPEISLNIYALCRRIKEDYQQDCVYLTRHQVRGELV